jgi:hypothetical protein
MDWMDYVEPTYDFSKHPGVIQLLTRLKVPEAASILLLSPCSGFFEFAVNRLRSPSAALDCLCTKTPNRIRLKKELENSPGFRVFSFDETVATPKQYDLILWFDFTSEVPGFGSGSRLLASSLKPGGTFAFVNARDFPNISPRMNWSPVALYQAFYMEGPEFPLFKLLSPQLAARVTTELAADQLEFSQATTLGIFAAINQALETVQLFKSLNEYYNKKSGFASEMISFAPFDYIATLQHLYLINSDSIVGDKPVSEYAIEEIRAINWLAITAILSISTERGRSKGEIIECFGQTFIKDTFEAIGLRFVSVIEDYYDIQVITFSR